jgi:hypothetical protein
VTVTVKPGTFLAQLLSIARHKPVEVWVDNDRIRVTTSHRVTGDDGCSWTEYEEQMAAEDLPRNVLIEVLQSLGINAREA